MSNRTVCVSRWRGFAPTSSAARVRRAVNEQRQGIIMVMISCLLFCGITFALCELGRPPYMAHWGQSLRMCVPGRALTPLARCNTLDFVPKSVCQGVKPLRIPAECVRTYAEKWQKFTISGVFFHGGVWYTQLSSTNKNLWR